MNQKNNGWTRTDFKQQIHGSEENWSEMCEQCLLFIPRYFSYTTDVLLAEVSTLKGSVVCRHFPCVLLQPDCLFQQAPLSPFACGLQSTTPTLSRLREQEGLGFVGLTGVSHVLPALSWRLLTMTWREEAKCHLVFQTFITVMKTQRCKSSKRRKCYLCLFWEIHTTFYNIFMSH